MFTVLPKTRNSRLHLIVALVLLSIALLSFAAAPSIRLHYAASSGSISNSYDRVELVRAERYMAAGAQQVYLDQPRGEWTAGNVIQQAVSPLSFRQAEQMAAVADAQNAYLNYRRGEWSGK